LGPGVFCRRNADEKPQLKGEHTVKNEVPTPKPLAPVPTPPATTPRLAEVEAAYLAALADDAKAKAAAEVAKAKIDAIALLDASKEVHALIAKAHYLADDLANVHARMLALLPHFGGC
jgi:hypothetical protein